MFFKSLYSCKYSSYHECKKEIRLFWTKNSGLKQLKRGSSQCNGHWEQNLPGCDCSKSFLASSIPNLQLDGFAVQFNGSNLEVDTNGADVALGVSVVRKPQQKARFTNTGVTDQKQLEQIITEKKRKICISKYEWNRGKFVFILDKLDETPFILTNSGPELIFVYNLRSRWFEVSFIEQDQQKIRRTKKMTH